MTLKDSKVIARSSKRPFRSKGMKIAKIVCWSKFDQKRRRLTKKSTVDHGSKILAKKSTNDKKVNGGRESRRLTPKS